MPDYKEMYFALAAQVADAVELLVKAQQNGEEQYVQGEERPPLEFALKKGAPRQKSGK